MSDNLRRTIFLVSAVVMGGLLVWGVMGLPDFGHYPGPYGDIMLKTTVPERHVTDVVTSIMFDQRGLDTLGEEFILFAAVTGVILLLRQHRESSEGPEESEDTEVPLPKTSAIAWLGLAFTPLVFLFGFYVIIHAHITVGGGFQGGIIVAAAWLLLYLADQRRSFRKLAPKHVVEIMEAFGAAGYGAMGLVGLAYGATFLQNVLPLGKAGELLSGGTIPLINFAVGIEVSAAFILLSIEFLYEAQQAEGNR